MAPLFSLGKIERFTDSQGVIHINSGGQVKGGQAKAPSGSGKPTLGALSGPAGIMGSHPAGEPPAEACLPGSENNEPPPDLGAVGQPWSLLQVAQSISGGKTAMKGEENGAFLQINLVVSGVTRKGLPSWSFWGEGQEPGPR